MSRARRSSVGLASAAFIALQAAGCGPECESGLDCKGGFDCTVDGVCVETGEATIAWIAPEPGSELPERFDAVVDVTFRGPTAELLVDRSSDDPGDPCAPSIPTRIIVPGDLDQKLTQRVTIPGMRALGATFSIAATVRGGGGIDTALARFTGAAADFGGALFTEPERPSVDAATRLTLPVSATFDGAVARATLWVEPEDAVGVTRAPSPRDVVGAGVTAITDVPVPLARGRQVVWLETQSGDVVRRCGLGLLGESDPATAPGLELGLVWDAAEPALLDLRARVDDGATCSFVEPVAGCEAVYETRGPARTGEEVLRVRGDGIVEVVVVPGAAGPPVQARVRVSLNGEHLGWLGPFSIQPALGETWVAGRILVEGGLADLQRIDDVVIGAPF